MLLVWTLTTFRRTPPPGLHMTARELQTRTFEGSGASKQQNSTRRHLERYRKSENGTGKGKKRKILGPPQFWDPPFGAPPFGAPPFGARFFLGLGPTFWAPQHHTTPHNTTQPHTTTTTTRTTTTIRIGQKWIGHQWIGQNWIGPNRSNQDGQNGIGQSRSLSMVHTPVPRKVAFCRAGVGQVNWRVCVSVCAVVSVFVVTS